MIAPTVIVAGLGRCGSSLTMQMLAAGGLPCVGSAPDFEDMRTTGAIDPAWWSTLPGRAVKVLDPHLNRIPTTELAVAIWLDRDRDQQARSQIKFSEQVIGCAKIDRSGRRRWRNSLVAARRAAREALWAIKPQKTLYLTFEAILFDPIDAAERVAFELDEYSLDLDVAAMARQVRRRSADCAPDLTMELTLIGEQV